MQVLKQTNKRPKELVDVRVPHAAGHLWEWFWDLDDAVDGKPLSHQEILAWRDLLGEIIEPWEVRALRRMSKVRRAEAEKVERSGL